VELSRPSAVDCTIPYCADANAEKSPKPQTIPVLNRG
jgi:hypothetical protein